ncbi:RHS repeat-associated core domain-containing protein [Stenotrophomonas maltophilia]|uniref:RHS repeat-associated core domain-containing protein n=1 Tax=Stenotrophomonas maltophilia TaxID=40324 RepID=UPI003D18B7E0
MIWSDNLPVGLLKGSALYYVQPDHLGTPRVVVDPARDVVVWSWDLKGEAFGATAPNEDPNQDGTLFEFAVRFPGQRYDGVSGLNQNYYGDYDASVGRYVQSDPIGIAGGIATYGYAESSPIQLSDRFGLASCYYSIRDERMECFPSTEGKQYLSIRVASGNNGGGMQCKNNPAFTSLQGRGPIPTGKWNWTNTWTSKPNVRALEPAPGTNTFGRSLIRSHSCANAFGLSLGPHFCSEGCVTGTAADLKRLNELIDDEPGSTLQVMDQLTRLPPRFW